MARGLVLTGTVTGRGAAIAQWEDQPAGSHVTPDPWPRIVKQGEPAYTLYQLQLDSWDGHTAKGHAAASVLPAGAKEPQFGVIGVTAKNGAHYDGHPRSPVSRTKEAWI